MTERTVVGQAALIPLVTAYPQDSQLVTELYREVFQIRDLTKSVPAQNAQFKDIDMKLRIFSDNFLD